MPPGFISNAGPAGWFRTVRPQRERDTIQPALQVRYELRRTGFGHAHESIASDRLGKADQKKEYSNSTALGIWLRARGTGRM